MESYEYLQQYYENVDNLKIISKTDIKGTITYANLNFCKISGYFKEELIGKKHSIVRHPDMPAKIFETMWKTILAGHVWRGEVKNKKKDGSAYWTKSDIIPIFENGKIKEFVSFREDITQRKLMELKLKKETNFKKELFNALPNVSLLIHKQKGLILCNDQFFLEFPFSSPESFNSKHTCICELFIEKKGYLKKSTKEKHWTVDLINNPNVFYKALIKNKQGIEQIFYVSLNKFKDDDLFLVSLVNVTFLDEAPIDIIDQSSVKISAAIHLIDSYFEKGVHPEFYKFFKEIENTLLGKK